MANGSATWSGGCGGLTGTWSGESYWRQCPYFGSPVSDPAITFQYKRPNEGYWHNISATNNTTDTYTTTFTNPESGTWYIRTKVIECGDPTGGDVNNNFYYYYPNATGEPITLTGPSITRFEMQDASYNTIATETQSVYMCEDSGSWNFVAESTGNSVKIIITNGTTIQWNTSGNIQGNTFFNVAGTYFAHVVSYTGTNYTGCSTKSGNIEIVAQDATPITINSFTATPTTITSGESSTLSFSLNRDADVIIHNNIGDPIITINNTNGSSVNVSPTQTVTYTLYASESCVSTKTATATITIPSATNTSYGFIS